jgi:RNA polymerase sigma-70 factor, ECF subfamily
MNKNPRQGNGSNKDHRFVGLLTTHYYKIHSFILAMVPNKADADDVLQNTITYMWEHFDDYEENTNFVAWAVTIAKYQVFTYRKHQKRSKIVFSDGVIDGIAEENEKLQGLSDERYEALQKCLQKVPKEEKSLLKDQYVDGKKIAQIAQEQGIAPTVMYRRYARLKGLLLECVRRTMATERLS